MCLTIKRSIKNRRDEVGRYHARGYQPFDHVGNLPLFSNAQILLSETEWESANQTPDEWHSIQTLAYLEKRGNLRFVKEGDIISEEVSVMELPGHTPGLIGLRCGAESILCSDAMKNRYELWKNIPLMSQNLEQSRRSIQRIKENARYIYPGHDGMLDLLHENSDEYPAVTLRYADGRQIDIKGISEKKSSPSDPVCSPSAGHYAVESVSDILGNRI